MEYFEILWNNALGELEKTVSSISYATFIETITPIDIQNNKLILMTPSEHFANAVNGRLGDKVRDALAREAKDSTKLIVAQRIGTIMNADRIVVLDDGKVVGQGTHKELLDNCDVYRQIAESQLSQSELTA